MEAATGDGMAAWGGDGGTAESSVIGAGAGGGAFGTGLTVPAFATAAPHREQNLVFGSKAPPQCSQKSGRVAAGEGWLRAAPHFAQNLSLSVIGPPHWPHDVVISIP